MRVGVDAGTGRVIATRPVYGGSAMAAVTFPGDGLQVVIMRGRAYEPPAPERLRNGRHRADIRRFGHFAQPCEEHPHGCPGERGRPP